MRAAGKHHRIGIEELSTPAYALLIYHVKMVVCCTELAAATEGADGIIVSECLGAKSSGR